MFLELDVNGFVFNDLFYSLRLLNLLIQIPDSLTANVQKLAFSFNGR